MVAGPQVYLGEHPSSIQPIEQVLNQGHWVLVLDGDRIQLAVVHTQP